MVGCLRVSLAKLCLTEGPRVWNMDLVPGGPTTSNDALVTPNHNSNSLHKSSKLHHAGVWTLTARVDTRRRGGLQDFIWLMWRFSAGFLLGLDCSAGNDIPAPPTYLY